MAHEAENAVAEFGAHARDAGEIDEAPEFRRVARLFGKERLQRGRIGAVPGT